MRLFYTRPSYTRPIVSGSASVTENIASYVQYYIKDISKNYQSYIQDTPDFLRYIEKINQGPLLGRTAQGDGGPD